jgi:hypothetical protein
MTDFNLQILDLWDQANVRDKRGDFTRVAMEESMQSLKFGYPARNTEELHEVSKLCLFYHTITHNPESILKEFRQVAKTLNVSLSLTDRCGNFCRHCSTKRARCRELHDNHVNVF